MNLVEVISGEALSYSLGYIVSRRKRYLISLQSFLKRKNDVRISDSYLFRINIDNKYLLIKNKNIEEYQPIGGVFKVYESFRDIKEKLEIHFESKENFYEDNDLRIIIKGKNLLKYNDWFNSRLNREVTVKREFIEELIDSEILPLKSLKDVEFEYIKTIERKLEETPYYRWEFNLKEIYDVIIPKEYHDNLKNHPNLILVESQDIKRQAIYINSIDKRIAEHSIYIL